MGSLDLVEEIKEICADLSGQAVDAAHYLINNPDEVAFHSMREIARRANVPPVSLVRLAQRLGLAGYSELRDRFIDIMRDRQQRDRMSITRNEQSARALIRKMGEGAGLEDFVESFFAAELDVVRRARAHLSEEKLREAVDLLANAQKVFVYGRRTAFTPAYTLAYTLRKARPNVILLDSPGGAPESVLEDLSPGDAFVAVTFAPFNRLVHRLTEKASLSDARVIAITDSFAAPVGEFAGRLHFVAQTSGQAFPESMLGAIAVAQLLAALTISSLGESAQNRIRENEQFLVGSGEYLLSGEVAKRRRAPTAASRKRSLNSKRTVR
ncbi:MurR/RpiR family transcriptional regulator [Bradyrhizobium sp. 190]|uniref:MurR/RpiR family transcriptional regulator n=1 Tax=Bradyrhizobium sp. 190 TaxID=2782658 RepID=UPI001FFC00BD|nr:MurR/RpiR family transcriptional regulator [Bradyrhizobium sp. 190]MCK1516970.1 MurR/RpiR family transcriptional regulator [Bradyrhizobium sp. 190]